jgi:hypothetical protein
VDVYIDLPAASAETVGLVVAGNDSQQNCSFAKNRLQVSMNIPLAKAGGTLGCFQMSVKLFHDLNVSMFPVGHKCEREKNPSSGRFVRE